MRGVSGGQGIRPMGDTPAIPPAQPAATRCNDKVRELFSLFEDIKQSAFATPYHFQRLGWDAMDASREVQQQLETMPIDDAPEEMFELMEQMNILKLMCDEERKRMMEEKDE